MVYTRKQNGKSTFMRKAQTVGEVAHKALSTALMVKKLLNVEYKHVDTAVITINPDSSGTVLPMNAVAEGTASNERTGLSVRYKSLFLRGYAVEHASATHTLIKICVIKALNPNGTTPTIANIFESTSPILALQNNINTKEYKILYSKYVTLASGGNENTMVEAYKQLNDVTKYNGSSGAATAIDWNGYYLVLISNQPTNTPSFQYTARLRYIDN